VKKPLVLPFVLSAVLFICGDVVAQSQPPIPISFFGQHVNNPRLNGETSYPLRVTYGQLRNWDVYLVSWPDIETCEAKTPVMLTDTCFGPGGLAENFAALQYELQKLGPLNANIQNVMFTLSRTPSWAVTANQALDNKCKMGICLTHQAPTPSMRGWKTILGT
jgi:hypothetical protein